ncbi:hypothetical protein [Methanosarcina mazei]|uniref:hypothetical protein n=1 Tax=Methanosarcina mazei TaxID=2209 RepID=UPI001910125F|nr:hypothetical protein [Methanosarcina mazei]
MDWDGVEFTSTIAFSRGSKVSQLYTTPRIVAVLLSARTGTARSATAAIKIINTFRFIFIRKPGCGLNFLSF